MKLAAILAALGITMLIYNVPHLWRDDGSAEGHALLLAAGQLPRFTV